jgi:hypothetical protein
MIKPLAYINVEERKLEWAEPITWHTPTIAQMEKIPLYTHPAKELDEQFKKGFEAGKEEGWKAHKFHHPAKTLTDEEIVSCIDESEPDTTDMIRFARAILRKAQEK